MLDKNQVIHRNADILVNEVDGETVMMSIENGTYYGMNPTGNYIWKLLEQEKSLADLLDGIAKTFSLDAAQCEKEVLPFIEKMLEENILLLKA